MVRARRVQAAGNVDNKDETNSSSSNGRIPPKLLRRSRGILSYWKHFIAILCIGIAIYAGYMGYLETRVNTPYDKKKMVFQSGLDIPERFWGTYRPGVYFGLKTRDPYSIVTGLMWYYPKRLRPGGDGIRHWCEQGDGLEKYGWLQHDGSDFGLQEIHDGPFLLTTSFVKRLGGLHGGDWTARIGVELKEGQEHGKGEEVSLIWYTALDESNKGQIKPSNTASFITGIRGDTPGLGEFTIKILNHTGYVEHESYLSTVTSGLHLLKETIIASLRLADDKSDRPKRVVLAGDLLQNIGAGKTSPNFIATQVTAKIPFTIDVVFESGSFGTRHNTLVGKIYSDALSWHRARFVQRFEDTFHLQAKSYDVKEIQFAQATLSNLIGGIGYFYGASRVQSSYTKEPVPYWRSPLYTAVPSRSFFPRGFLWDEGFHGLLISTWDVDIELDIINHWFDLMNAEGWIPREQILGVEALSKVPKEFVTQRNTNANPPTFFLTLHFILKKYKDQLTDGRLQTLERLYPRLQAWFLWFNTTQRGPELGTYRWRGRDELTNRELNPKTLTSGLDDYPRASHPTDNERHLDLRCWMAIASDVMAKLALLLGRNSYKYFETFEYLSDNDLLDKLHWSDYGQMFADYGLHTDAVVLQRPKITPRTQTPQNLEMVRITKKNPEYRFVDSSFGYISLFPFLSRILDPSSQKLNKTLMDLQNPDLLWTRFGLRSLAKTAPLYMKRNTEHDPPYWRGQIWININYLAVVSLNHYSVVHGPYQELARQIYLELRKNIISNVMNQYLKTGFVWEQYNDITGEGSGCRPFTGWSALVVLLMGEEY